ncbi:hypothetical protein VQL36_05520 [Chengkuizengella sp. SCS-71B]|uniref:hypothetical protein n=1 Tax=Chengkuizengella sp. SCS-71B TaxID=3115290 RepID=UPI0032C22B07
MAKAKNNDKEKTETIETKQSEPQKEKPEIVENKKANTVKQADDIIYFQAKKALSKAEHEQLSQKVRFENEQTGLNIVLVPHSVDLKVGAGDGK